MSYPKFSFPSLSSFFDEAIDAEGALIDQSKSKAEEKVDLQGHAYAEAYKELENKLQEELHKNKFSEVFKCAFDASTISSDLLEELLQHNARILESILDTLCLEMPSNFNLILQRLFGLIKQHYKEGGITIEVSSDCHQICLDMIKDLPDSLFKKDLIEVVKLPGIDKDFCRIRYKSTTFEYDRNQIVEEIKEQLKLSC